MRCNGAARSKGGMKREEVQAVRRLRREGTAR
nr:MAG TPA: hypothetical protein [Caudoviricetes sp.]